MTKERDRSDPNWRAVYDEELARWKAKSYADLQVALSDVIARDTCCVHYDREVPGGPYQIEVQLLENEPDYLHVLVSVCAPHGLICRPISGGFIRHADGRVD